MTEERFEHEDPYLKQLINGELVVAPFPKRKKTSDGYVIKQEYAALKSLDERLEWIINSMDEGRFDIQGGYPSQWTTRGNWIYVATVDHDDGPELIAMPIRQFLQEYKWVWAEDY